MSKKRRKSKSRGKEVSTNAKKLTTKVAWIKSEWKSITALLILVSVSYTGFAAYKLNWEKMHDLSVIGNGTPTVVQVHDPSCAMCRELKKNTKKAVIKFDEKLQYRIADLTTSKGIGLAIKHDAKKVTLLTFDKNGEFIDKHVGVRSVDVLEQLFVSLTKRKE